MNTEFAEVEACLRPVLGRLAETAATVNLRAYSGRITELSSTIIRARMARLLIGEVCLLGNPGTGQARYAEVVGFDRDETLLSPLDGIEGLSSASPIIPTGTPMHIGVGDALLGRVVNARVEPVDDAGPLEVLSRVSIRTPPYPAIKRRIIDTAFNTGIRAIDGLLTLGKGQRIGITGPPGSGKSSLLSAILRHATFDVAIVAMIGERGREVREFVESGAGPHQRNRCVFVVSTSEESPGNRVLGADSAVRIAEYFADQGLSVLLMFDSLTRYARAKRDIGLAVGEAPTRRGFTAQSLSSLATLIEKCGLRETGDITAVFTILTEGDQDDDPVREEALSLLDGHIELSPELANRGHYPAIDILKSKSRLINAVVAPDYLERVNTLRGLMKKYEEVELLLQIGEYQEGADPLADRSIQKRAEITAFLRQGLDESPRKMRQIQRMIKSIIPE